MNDAVTHRWEPPRFMLPGLLDTRLILVRTPRLVATLEGFRVWRQGIEFELHVQTDPSVVIRDQDGRNVIEFDSRHPGNATDLFELGVVADGQQISTASGYPPPGADSFDDSRLLLTPRGGGGGTDALGGLWRTTWWLTPLPTSDIEFWCQWEPGRIPRSAAVLDAGTVRAAASRAD